MNRKIFTFVAFLAIVSIFVGACAQPTPAPTAEPKPEVQETEVQEPKLRRQQANSQLSPADPKMTTRGMRQLSTAQKP